MFLALILIAQDAQPAPAAAEPPRFSKCMNLATDDPAAGRADAIRWLGEGGGIYARQCLGIAYANQGGFDSAAAAFAEAAREAARESSSRVADFWVQSGNAWLAAGQPAQACDAFTTALGANQLQGLALGEGHLDRARAFYLLKDFEGARSDLDKALEHAAADPAAWLLSARVARTTGDLKLAAAHITQALQRSPDDGLVQLEAGNIAALTGDEANARTAWQRAIDLAPGSPIAQSAREALQQFGTSEH